MKANEFGLARFDQSNAFLLILRSGGISYVRPFFGGMPASSSVSWSTPLAKMLSDSDRSEISARARIPRQTWATTRASALAPFAGDIRAVKRKTSNKVLQHM
jgi:hypothetical protein